MMITANICRWIYLGLTLIGLTLGATTVGYSSVDATQPAWLIVAQAVFGFLAGGSGILAALNTVDQDIRVVTKDAATKPEATEIEAVTSPLQ